MGEAKRRKLKQATAPVFEGLTENGNPWVRQTGDPIEFLRAWLNGATETPCGKCIACCYTTKVELDPDQDSPVALAHLDYTVHEDGSMWLRKRADGACVHLGPTGCTVYEHRPYTCRRYDCRLGGLVGMADVYEGQRRSPLWMFKPESGRSRWLIIAGDLLGVIYHYMALRDGEEPNVQDAALFLITHMSAVVTAMEAAPSTPAGVTLRQLGLLPKEFLPGDYLEVVQAVTERIVKIHPTATDVYALEANNPQDGASVYGAGPLYPRGTHEKDHHSNRPRRS